MQSSDNELVSAYAAKDSQEAFRALVARHVDLVYATAMRQVGDRGLAEEITQNVFLALARKAPRLGGLQTLGGWLHRTTVLEAKTRIRGELRRRRREQTAAEAVQLAGEGASSFAALEPLLDEGLLHLREPDRQALLLRFWEAQSLKEMGAALGIDEDAARKRVARALDRLSDFFRQRGFAASAAVCGGALASSSHAAPTGLAVAAAQAAMASATPATGLSLWWLHLMNLAKTQTTLVCLVLAAVPLAWQARTQAQLVREQDRLQAETANSQQSAGQLEQQLERANRALERAQEESRRAEARLNELSGRRANPGPAPKYRWDDSSPVLRVPKAFLAQIDIGGLNAFNNQLNPATKTLLQLTPKEAEQTQAAVDKFLADYHAAQSRALRQVQPAAEDLKWHPGRELRVFDVPAVGDSFTSMRQNFFDELQYIMGEGRFALFKKSLEWWMPLDDGPVGASSAQPIFNCDRRVRFYQPRPGDSYLNWDFDMPAQGSYSSGTLLVDEIPQPFRSYLKDWIELARPQPATR